MVFIYIFIFFVIIARMWTMRLLGPLVPNGIYYIVCIPLCVVVNLEQERLRTQRKSSSTLPTLLPEACSRRSRQVANDIWAILHLSYGHLTHILETFGCYHVSIWLCYQSILLSGLHFNGFCVYFVWLLVTFVESDNSHAISIWPIRMPIILGSLTSLVWYYYNMYIIMV